MQSKFEWNIYIFKKNINSLSLSFHWSFHAFHKCALFISQVVRLTKIFQTVHSTADFFSCIFWVFWTTLFESTFGRILLEQYFSFSDLVFYKFLPNWTIIHFSIFFLRDSLWNCIQLLHQTNKQIQKSLDWLKNLLKHSQILI